MQKRGFSFPRGFRLLRPEDFLRVRKKGQRAQTAHFIVHRLPNGLEHPRLGLSVSTRVGGAAVRNRIKRFVREFFRLNAGELPPEDILVTAKSGAEPLTSKDTQEELGFLIKRNDVTA